jgi:hypothetical protein
MGESSTLKDIAALLIPAFVSSEVVNDDLSTADIKNLATVLGAELVTLHLVKKLKDAIKNTTFSEVNAIYTTPSTANKANVEDRFQQAFTTVLARKVKSATAVVGDNSTLLIKYILSTGQKGLGSFWYNKGVATWVPGDYLASFKAKASSPTNASPTAGTDWVMSEVVSDPTDPNDETYLNTSLYGLSQFDFSSSNIANKLREINSGNFISGADIPSEPLFTFADAIHMVTGTRTNNITATASQVSNALNLTTKIGVNGILSDINTSDVPKSIVSTMNDSRIVSALRNSAPDVALDYVDDTTSETKKYVTGGYYLYTKEITVLINYLKLKGQTSKDLIALNDSLSGYRTDINAEDLYSRLIDITNDNRLIGRFYNSSNVADSTKNISYTNVLHAFLGYESGTPQDPATITNAEQLVTYLTTDKLYGPQRTIVDSSDNVNTTTAENNNGFNSGGSAKLRTFLSENKILSLELILIALKKIANDAITFSGSKLTADQVLRKTFQTIENNLDVSDFPALYPVPTSGKIFYGIPSSINDDPTPNLIERLVALYAVQKGNKIMDIADNHKFLPMLVSVSTSQTKNNDATVTIKPQQTYALGVNESGSACPAVDVINPKGGLINMGTAANMYAAFKANTATLGAGEDLILRTFIATTITGGLVDTASELDTVIQEFGIGKIAGLVTNPKDKAGNSQIASPTTLDDGNTNIANSNKFSNALSSITLKGYVNSSVAGHSAALDAFTITSILVDIYRSITIGTNKTRKVAELLNANPEARDRFFVQSPLVDLTHQALFRTFLSDAMTYNEDSVVKSWITSKNVKGEDALQGLNGAINTSGLSGKNLSAAVDDTSTSKLTIGNSGVIKKLAGFTNSILNKDAWVDPTTKEPENKPTYADLAKLTNMIAATQAIIITVAAAAADDNGEYKARLTQSKFNELKGAGFIEDDILNSVLAYPKTSGFDFMGILYKFFVGTNTDGTPIFDS